MFAPTSRYYELPTKTWKDKDGRKRVYVQRRFLPLSHNDMTVAEHTVADHERLDHITARHLDDPELFWRLCDVNDALHPVDLTAVSGQKLKIPLLIGV